MHNVEYYTYNENVDKNNVQKELDAYVAYMDHQEGCSGLGGPIRWLSTEPISANYDLAVKAIERNDQGWYDCLAVKYLEPERGFNDKKLESLKAKSVALYDAYQKKNSVWAAGLKAEYVGCKNCGSKIKREYIRSNNCPVCRAELRPTTTLNAVNAALERYKKARAACDEYANKHAKKMCKWLVKIEYHT